MQQRSPSYRAALLERIQDLLNYLAHIELFPSYLPAGTDPRQAEQDARQQLSTLRNELRVLA